VTASVTYLPVPNAESVQYYTGHSNERRGLCYTVYGIRYVSYWLLVRIPLLVMRCESVNRKARMCYFEVHSVFRIRIMCDAYRLGECGIFCIILSSPCIRIRIRIM
jgi:hypothetical protein